MKSILLFIIVTLLCAGIYSKDNNNGKRKPSKISFSQVANQRMDINNLNALESNTGFSDYNLNDGLEGTEFPKGSGKNIIFESGLLWGGFVQGDNSGQVRVGGSTYNTGLEPGPILSTGMPADPTDSKWSVYRVRPDVYPGGPAVDLSGEVAAYAEGGQTVTESQLRTQYESDWTNWPAHGTANDLGAPFTDVNGDGIYEPGTDIPGVPGADQTCYFVANDMDTLLTQSLYGTMPLGIELHATYWAYNQGGAPGNVYFKKYTLINKGFQHNQIDSMFISFWVDCDLGNASDDLVGTDTTLNLIYTYNGESTDAVYSPLTPPSVGFSLLEGPIINGKSTDTALFNGKKITGKKNLPMTADYFFMNSNAEYGDPPMGSPAGATQFYNFFNGEYGLSGLPYTNPNNGQLTKYVFTGDPVASTGWVDGAPADKRQGMASGPFTMAPGDTQEIVFAEIAGEGTDYLHSVYNVKEYQYDAASAFKNLINGVKSPSPLPPVISLSNDSSSIQIQWDNKAESFNQAGYSFEGYNLYQLSAPFDSKESAMLIASFDKVDGIKTIYGQALNPLTDQVYSQLQQSGSDTGLQYSFKPTIDYINNYHFVKGKNYYYAVTAYAFNPAANANPTNTESNFQPGNVAYNYNLSGPNYGDTVQVTHIAGQSLGNVTVIVNDPSKLTGHSYNVLFDTLYGGAIVWDLKDMTNASVIISMQPLNTSQIIDGVNITVTSPNPGMNQGGEGIGWTIPSGTRRFTWGTTSLLSSYGLEGFNGAIGWSTPNYLYNGGPESVPVSSLCSTLLTLAQVTDTSLYNPAFPPASDVNLSYGYRYLRHASMAAADPRFSPYIINTTGGTYPFQDFKQSVPLSAWNVDNAAHPVRLALGYLENNAVGGLVDGKYWPPDYTQLDQANTREFLWIFQSPYTTTANSSYEEDALSSTSPLPIMWFCIFSRRGDVPFSPGGTGTDQFLIIKNNTVELNDVFAFNTLNITDVKTKNIISKFSISQNYPNPFNPATIIEFSLAKPEHVILKIYDILGRQVATLVDDVRPTGIYSIQFNASKFASGVYFYRIQAGSFVQTKKLLLLK